MKFLMYHDEEIDDKVTQTEFSKMMIEFNAKLMASGVKMTRYTDGLKEPKVKHVRNDEQFRGKLLQGNYERWLNAITPKKQ